MTQEEIIRMAMEAGLITNVFDEIRCNKYQLERFANLVAEATKEKAAKVCEERDDAYGTFSLAECAAAIRSMK